MNYLSKQVGRDDQVVEAVKISYLGLVSSVIWGAVFVYIGLQFQASESRTIFFGMAALFVLLKFLDIRCTHLGYSTRKVIGRQGIVNSKTMDSPLNKIDNVSVNKSLFGMMLGYSKVEINSVSGSYKFNYIVKGEQFKQNLMDTVDRYEKDLLNQQAQQIYAMNMQTQQPVMNENPQPQYPMNGYPQQPQGYNNYNQPMN